LTPCCIVKVERYSKLQTILNLLARHSNMPKELTDELI